MNAESGANANAANQVSLSAIALCCCISCKPLTVCWHCSMQNSGGSYDIGLWQINDMNWASCSGGKAPCDPNTNLNCAKKVFGWGGNTWKVIFGLCQTTSLFSHFLFYVAVVHLWKMRLLQLSLNPWCVWIYLAYCR